MNLAPRTFANPCFVTPQVFTKRFIATISPRCISASPRISASKTTIKCCSRVTKKKTDIPKSKGSDATQTDPNSGDNRDAEELKELFPDCEEAVIEEAQDELRHDFMLAYFEATDTTYQPTLGSFTKLGFQNFSVELKELFRFLRRLINLDPPKRFIPPEVLGLTLNNDVVSERERQREKAEGKSPASPIVRFIYNTTCAFLDVFFLDRPIPRFWFLETVARMPYFAYASCLHLYATLGWYRSPTMMNMHHAEELNEAYHLSVMESLGGDKAWLDRFVAYHASILYYWFLVILFIVSPGESYRFSKLLELHAVDTYRVFLEENETTLKRLPVPDIAKEYYANFLYYFYEFHHTMAEEKSSRIRPELDSLFDVFDNILLDEIEHSKTMTSCAAFTNEGEIFYYNGKKVSASARNPSELEGDQRQDFWRKWVEMEEQTLEDSS